MINKYYSQFIDPNAENIPFDDLPEGMKKALSGRKESVPYPDEPVKCCCVGIDMRIPDGDHT